MNAGGKYCFSQKLLTGEFYRAWLPPRLCHKETRRSRRLRGQEPLSPRSPPAEVVGSAATPPFGGSPLSGAQPPSLATSLLLSSPQCISCSQFDVKMFFHSQQTNIILKQNKDVGMGLRISLLGIFLFPFSFMP